MPIFYAIGGPNGSGKTTFMKSFFDNNISVLRPDDLMIADPFSLQEAIQFHLQDLASTQQDFAFEHNFHTSTSYRYFDWAKKQGYQTKLLGLTNLVGGILGLKKTWWIFVLRQAKTTKYVLY
jgi:predicted ABC-type ATPase